MSPFVPWDEDQEAAADGVEVGGDAVVDDEPEEDSDPEEGVEEGDESEEGDDLAGVEDDDELRLSVL
jgi:hypothetical protein